MPRIRYLHIRFDQPVEAREIHCFRAAVIEKTRRESSLFHNHRESGEGFHYRYPLIQYKRDRGKASILCLNQGTDDIHHLLQVRSLDLAIGDRGKMPFRIEDMHLQYCELGLGPDPYPYRLNHWLALSQKNYALFRDMQSGPERLAFLERILVGNILSMAQGFDWHIEEKVELKIDRMFRQYNLPYKGQPLLAFDLDFRCNVRIPPFIGLGKGASTGYGVVRPGRARRPVADNLRSAILTPVDKGITQAQDVRPGASARRSDSPS